MGGFVCLLITSTFTTHNLGHCMVLFFFFLLFLNIQYQKRFDASVSTSGLLMSSSVGVLASVREEHTLNEDLC